jgi:hypothetical protein
MADERNLDRALDIVSGLIMGEEITSKTNIALYENYQTSAEVSDLVRSILKKMNLCLYEYRDGLYIGTGENNRIFGYSNEELKKEFGVKVNKELFLCYFIIYHVMLEFYTDTTMLQFVEFTRVEDIVRSVDKTVRTIIGENNGILMEEQEAESFRTVALLWDELDTAGGSEDAVIRSAKNSKAGYVKMVFNFLVAQDLFTEAEGRYYPNNRFKALMENYFDDYKGRIHELMKQKGETQDATD